MTLNSITIPHTQFRNGSELLTYDKVEYFNTSKYFGKRLRDSIKRAREAKCGRYGFSKNAKKRFKRAANNLSLLSPRRWKHNPYTKRPQTHEVSFITLTIAQDEVLDGRFFMDNLLHPFLKWFSRYATTSNGKGVHNYIWKIELQAKRKTKQLHCHIITNDMVHWEEIRRKWNRLQSAAGCLGGHRNPNGTDIKSFKADRLALYLLKEIAKEEQNPVGLTCPMWGCSEGLEESYFQIELKHYHERKLNKLRRANKLKTKTGDHWTFNWLPAGMQAQTEILTEGELQQFEDRIRIMGGVIERPKPIVIEIVEEVPWFDLMQQKDILLQPETRPPPLQINLFNF